MMFILFGADAASQTNYGGAEAPMPLPRFEYWKSWSPSGKRVSIDSTGADSSILLRSENKTLRVLHSPQALSGQFDVTVNLSPYNGASGGLLLAEAKAGQPDPDNWVVIERAERGGELVVLMYGRRDGQKLIVEPPLLQDIKVEGSADQLKKRMSRGVIHLHADAPALRVIRNTVGGVIHLQFADHRVIDGRPVAGWTELPTLADRQDAEYFLGVFARKPKVPGGGVEFSDPRLFISPLGDRDDAQTGFGATRRPYTWGGYTGDAVVVTFDERSAYRDEKFVFWSEANYIPWWHLDDKAAVSYEFVEIWGGDTVGCNEPMSDHLLRYTQARVLESNDARVVVEWDYVLIDSAYRWWNNHPTIRPRVKELYTFYPDGTGVRKVTYWPPLEDDETFHKWGHELAEIMVISAGGERFNRHLDQQALSILGMNGEQYDYLWDLTQYTQDQWRHDTDDWPVVIGRANMKDGWPSAYIAFGLDKKYRKHTNPTVPISVGGTWELRGRSQSPEFLSEDGLLDFGGFSHWPVMKQPYDDREWIGATYLREPKHTALISITTGEAGYTWPKGPKQRTYAMLIGLTDRDRPDEMREWIDSWLEPGRVETHTRGLKFLGVDYYERGLRFKSKPSSQHCRFTVTPDGPLRNPVFLIEDWTPERIAVYINDEPLSGERFRHDVVDGQSIVWLDLQLDVVSHFRISRNENMP